MRRAETIGAGIAAANDHHALTHRDDFFGVSETVARAAFVLLRQIIHGEMDALQFVSRDFQRRGAFSAPTASNTASKSFINCSPVGFTPTVNIGPEFDTFAMELLQPAVHHSLFQLEIRNPIAQQSANAVVLFKHHDLMPDAIQLLRRCQTRRSGSNNRYFLAGARRGGSGSTQPCPKAWSTIFCSTTLIVTGLIVDPQNASRLARRRANAASKLRKIVR